MHLQTILLFMVLNEAFSYYFYNPTTHDVIIRSSLNSIPSGYKLIPPPKTSRKRSRFQRDRISGSCTDAGFTCTSPYDKSLTFQYECDNDNNCPKNYKCCNQKCFVHKICSKAVFPQTRSNNDNNCNGCVNANTNNQRPGQCERWPYNCPKPYDYSLTSTFKCNYDKQCPKNFKCCQQSCFLHKICSRITSYSNKDDAQNWEFKPKPNPTTEAKTETEFDMETEQSTEESKMITEDFESKYDEDTTTDVDTTTDITTDTETETENVIDVEERTTQTEPSLVSDSLKPIPDLQTEVTNETEQTQTTTEMNIEDYSYEDEDEDDYDDADDDEDENEEEDNVGTNSETAEDKETKEITNPSDISEYKAFQAKLRTNDLLLTTARPILGKVKNSHSIRTHDYNEIVPEYAQYYYYYDENNLH